jgi:peptidoglycan/LPS O-acetylase OafA/YrhL
MGDYAVLMFLLSTCLALFVSSVLSRIFQVRDVSSAASSRVSTLDGLRGFLAMGVFYHHFVVTYYWKTTGDWFAPDETLYRNFGKVGVALFFMITGYLFFNKIASKSGVMQWRSVYYSRIIRIVPLYYFVVLIITALAFFTTGPSLNVSISELVLQVFAWLLFYGGMINDLPVTVLIIAGVDWTLRYEWFFYFTLPIYALLIRKLPSYSLLVLLALTFFSFIMYKIFSFYPAKWFVLFFIGGIFSTVPKSTFSFDFDNIYWSSLGGSLVIFCFFYPSTMDVFHVVGISSLFGLIVYGNGLFGLLNLRSSLFLGDVSYSVYLMHGVLLYIFFSVPGISLLSPSDGFEFIYNLPILTLLLVVVSVVTYFQVEMRISKIMAKYSPKY